MRVRGTAVTDNGQSSGADSFMKLFDTAMDTISQGGVRRGAFAAYLDIDLPDIEEFLQIKDIGGPLQNLFSFFITKEGKENSPFFSSLNF
ncbi:MAG TPA: hypothetical protein PKA54_06375 [Chitinophagaceae bacterium]|nr:MAG: ribonucleotide-diphosphate reductase subunit alpha [Bacteroidetes bacterium OLB11]HMN32980.1 hypothetical protein [Chitinophagaceae bacterium]